jgi:hypothetical protein
VKGLKSYLHSGHSGQSLGDGKQKMPTPVTVCPPHQLNQITDLLGANEHSASKGYPPFFFHFNVVP